MKQTVNITAVATYGLPMGAGKKPSDQKLPDTNITWQEPHLLYNLQSPWQQQILNHQSSLLYIPTDIATPQSASTLLHLGHLQVNQHIKLA